MKTNTPTTLAAALRSFFAEHLPFIRGLSPHTVHSYRDAFLLLFRFLVQRHGCEAVDLDIDHLGPDDVLGFLDDLEINRGNSVATRNARLAAIHAFARFLAFRYPEHIEACQRMLAVPFKRAPSRSIDYLDENELQGMLQVADRNTAKGRRDYCLILTLFNTGARVQELLGIRGCDVQFDHPCSVRLLGKGQKERVCPLWTATAQSLRALLADNGKEINGVEPAFCNRRGQPLTRYGVRYILEQCARQAAADTPRLTDRRIHPHMLRHSTAVSLLRSGVDLVTISHWLGHASIETTNRYAVVDLEAKREALNKVSPITQSSELSFDAWRSDESILEWLESL